MDTLLPHALITRHSLPAFRYRAIQRNTSETRKPDEADVYHILALREGRFTIAGNEKLSHSNRVRASRLKPS